MRDDLGGSLLCRLACLQILMNSRHHVSSCDNGPDDKICSAYDFAAEGPVPTNAAPSRSKAASDF